MGEGAAGGCGAGACLASIDNRIQARVSQLNLACKLAHADEQKGDHWAGAVGTLDQSQEPL